MDPVNNGNQQRNSSLSTNRELEATGQSIERQLAVTLQVLVNIADGGEFYEHKYKHNGKSLAEFEGTLTTQQNKILIDATIDCFDKILERSPLQTDEQNMNMLAQRVHSALYAYLRGTMQEATSKSNVDFSAVASTVTSWGATLERVTDEYPDFYAQYLIKKIPLMHMLISDSELSDKVPKDSFGTTNSPSYKEYVATLAKESVPSVTQITEDTLEDFQIKDPVLLTRTGPNRFPWSDDSKLQQKELKLEPELDTYLVSWRGKSDANGLVIAGNPVVRMESYGIRTSKDNQPNDWAGYCNLIPRSEGDASDSFKAIVMVHKGTEVTVDPALTAKYFSAPTPF